MSLTSAVADALTIVAPAASQDQVKDIVARRLDELSPGATIKKTGYFNHSWIPDLVVGWRNEKDRPVFLRFDVQDSSFGQDLEYLASDRPFFLDLINGKETKSDDGDAEFDLSAALSREGRDEVLVSEVSAIDRFESGVQKRGDTNRATRQVVVGGRGLIDQTVASQIVKSWALANEAVVEANTDELRGALDEVERYLDRIASLDLESELRASWVASGHGADAFPGREEWSLEDRGPHEIAGLVDSLLGQTKRVSPSEWERIARAIDLSALGHELSRLGRSRRGGTVDDLVRAGMAHWTAQYVYAPPLESDTLSGRFEWSTGRYALAVNLIRRQAYFTDIGRKWNNMAKEKALPVLGDRLGVLDGPGVLGAGIQTTEERVAHELRSTSTSSIAENINPNIQNQAAWNTARLQWLELRVPGTTSTARVNFERNLVRAETSVPLRSLVLLTAKYVAALDQEEMAALEESLGPVPT